MKTTTLAIVAAMAAGTVAHAQEAVQWRVEDGGNGHWYQLAQAATCWSAADQAASQRGAHLVSTTSLDEYTFVYSLASEASALVWLGAFRLPDASLLDWEWTDGSPFDATLIPWAPKNPGCCFGQEYWLGIWTSGGSGVHDIQNCQSSMRPLYEWSADCNGDGIVDYGQILDGTFADANENGVPDCCDEGVSCDPCLGDVNNDGQVNGADISVLLGFWGLNGKPVAADINKDGSVDGADLAALLGGWGECP